MTHYYVSHRVSWAWFCSRCYRKVLDRYDGGAQTTPTSPPMSKRDHFREHPDNSNGAGPGMFAGTEGYGDRVQDSSSSTSPIMSQRIRDLRRSNGAVSSARWPVRAAWDRDRHP